MSTISVKIDRELQEKLSLTALRNDLSQTELIRRALTRYLEDFESGPKPRSAPDMAGDLAGCLKGGPSDLSTNPVHLAERW
jgi:hypothetical protein